MEDIPIDIHIPKLLDWLISRRICLKDWQAKIIPIREKISSAMQDMPEHKDIAELLSGTFINYFNCCRIVEILKETEADTKNLFGMYGSHRMKDWNEIVKLYTRDNVYLAEAANLLIKTVKYEVPNTKKQLAKLKQNQQECEKKMVEYEKSVSSNIRELDTMRKQFGIEGRNVKRELLERVAHLDENYEIIATKVKNLGKSLQYFCTFIEHVTEKPADLPLLRHVIQYGNTTVYEYVHGYAPALNITDSDSTKNPDIEQQVSPSADEIDWGDLTDEVSAAGLADEQIDWGVSDIEQDCQIKIEDSGISIALNQDEDNSGIRMVNSQELESKLNSNEAADESNSGSAPFVEKKKKQFKIEEMGNILDIPKTRNEFSAQLLELRTFLKLRLFEIKNENDSICMLTNIEETKDDVADMLDNVETVWRILTDPTIEQLHFMKHSRRYIDKVASLFAHKEANIEKMAASKEAVKIRQVEASQSEKNLRPKLRLIMEKTRELQKQIEQDISKRYSDRPVHLLGGF